MTDTEHDAAKALASIQRSQADVADRISRGGWGYDLIYSVLLATMVGGFALGMPLSSAVTAVCVSMLLLLATTWAKRNGVWINGTTPPRARWVAIGLGLLQIPLLLVNLIWVEARHGVHPWPLYVPFLTTVAAFGMALVGSRLWRVVYRREMGLD